MFRSISVKVKNLITYFVVCQFLIFRNKKFNKKIFFYFFNSWIQV